MNDKEINDFLIQFKKAKKFVGKKWLIILPALKFFTNHFLLPTKFYATYFLVIKYHILPADISQ